MNNEEAIKEIENYLNYEGSVSIQAIATLYTLYENKKYDYLKLQAFYEKDYIKKDKILKIIKLLEKEQEENRKNLSLGIELLSKNIIDKFSNKIIINFEIRKYLENILKGE